MAASHFHMPSIRFIAAGLALALTFGIEGITVSSLHAQPRVGAPVALSTSALIDSALLLIEQKDFPAAQAVLETGVRFFPKTAQMRYWLGITRYEQMDDEGAVKHFQAAMYLDRNAPEAHIGLGRVYMRMKNRLMDAHDAFQDALKLDPANADTYYYAGLSYIETAKRDPAAPLYVMKARKAFQNAIANRPQHPDAYYQLALTYEDRSKDYETAMAIFYRQLSVNPGHADALQHFGQCCFLANRYQEGADLLKQLVNLHGTALPTAVQTLMAQLDASNLLAQKQYDKAEKVYETFIAGLPDQEKALYRDLSLVASKEEADAYQTASDGEKGQLWLKYWALRDPDPATVVNERLVEHYRRLTYARQHFSQAQHPWDRRGAIYIRYGDPDDLQHFVMRAGEKSLSNYQPTGNARIDAIRERNYLLRYRLKVDTGGVPWGSPAGRKIQDPVTDERTSTSTNRSSVMESFLLAAGEETQGMAFIAESWVYVTHDLELFFVDQLGMGKFDYPLGAHETSMDESSVQDRFHPQRLADELFKRTPEAYAFDYGGETLDFLYDMVTYRSDRGDSTDVEVSYVVPTRQLGSVEDGQGLKTWFDSHLVLRDEDLRRVVNVAERIGPIERPLTKAQKNRVGVDLRVASMELKAPAGKFRSAVEVRDTASQRVGIFEQPFTVPDYRGSGLMVSDIKLALSVQATGGSGPFTRRGFHIEPNPARLYQRPEPVYFYYELYNLTLNPQGHTSYRTELEITAKERQANIIWRLLSSLGKLVNRSDTDQTIVMTFQDEGSETTAPRYTSIGLEDTPAGDYTVKLTVTDLLSNQSVSKSKDFVVTNDRSKAIEKEETPPEKETMPVDGGSK